MSTPQERPDEHSDVVDAEPVLTLIRKIKENRLDPVLLTPEDRRRCVEVLRGEGYTVPEIGQILNRAERTIHRDLVKIREQHALQLHPQFALQMAGEMVQHAELAIGRLRRIAREPAPSAMERAIAETSAWKVRSDLISKLQSLGYLPRVPTGVVAQVIDHTSNDPIANYDQLKAQIDELEKLDRELGIDDPERSARRRTLTEAVNRGRLSAQVEHLALQRPEEN